MEVSSKAGRRGKPKGRGLICWIPHSLHKKACSLLNSFDKWPLPLFFQWQHTWYLLTRPYSRSCHGTHPLSSTDGWCVGVCYARSIVRLRRKMFPVSLQCLAAHMDGFVPRRGVLLKSNIQFLQVTMLYMVSISAGMGIYGMAVKLDRDRRARGV